METKDYEYGIRLGGVKDGKRQAFIVARHEGIPACYAREILPPYERRAGGEEAAAYWEPIPEDQAWTFDFAAVEPTLWLDEQAQHDLVQGMTKKGPDVSENDKLIDHMKDHITKLETANHSLQKQLLLETKSRLLIVEGIVMKGRHDQTSPSGPAGPGA